MEGSTPRAEERFAEWFVWAKREVGTDAVVCLAAAQAAVEAIEGGADEAAARQAARRSIAGHGIALVARIPPRHRAYAEWYDWARREVGGDRERRHTAVRVALEQLEQGADPGAAAAAARSAGGPLAPTPAPAPPAQAGPPAGAPWSPPGAQPAPGIQPAPAVRPAEAVMPAQTQPAMPAHAPSPYGPVPAPVHPLASQAAPVAPLHVYGGVLRRLGAYAIDAVLLGVGLVVVAFVVSTFALIGLISSNQAPTAESTFGILLALLAIAFVLSWLYFAGLESSPWRATVGKRLVGLVVADVRGGRLSFSRATGRYFGKLIIGAVGAIVFLVVALLAQLVVGGAVAGSVASLVLAVVVAGALGAGFVASTRRRQALHDLMASTLVVRREHLSEVLTAAQPPSAAQGSQPGGGGTGEVQSASRA